MSIRVRLQSPHAVPADYDFEGTEIVIGRAASAAVVIPDTRVSRQHARIVRRDGDWWVEDLGTRNGTLLNGELMAGAAKLKAGDRLGIGDSIVRFIGDEADGTTAAPADPQPPTLDEAQLARVRAARDAIVDVEWEPGAIHEALMKVVEASGEGPNKTFMPLRLAVTGKKVSPPIDHTLALLPTDVALKRLARVLD